MRMRSSRTKVATVKPEMIICHLDPVRHTVKIDEFGLLKKIAASGLTDYNRS